MKEAEIFRLKKYIENLEEDNKWCHSMINKQQKKLMNFSDLPENSWEKVMVKLVDFIGGDGPSLVNWSNEIPNPEQTAKQILGIIAYYDKMDEEQTERFINNFIEYCNTTKKT
jgi:hypothetical protein